jgi:flagellar biosynthesis protein FlhG
LKIITIASGKGGVGKSVIAANMAYQLASTGKRVLIFDGTNGLANLDIIFNVKVKISFLDFLNGEVELDDVTIRLNDNLDLVPSESGNEILQFSTDHVYSMIVNALSKYNPYDYLIIDANSGITDSVQTYLNYSDEILLVTTPNPASITDLYTLIKILSTKTELINLIVNMTSNEDEGGFIYKNITKVIENNLSDKLKIRFLGSLNRSRVISKNSKLRQLFCKSSQNSFSAYQLALILDSLNLDKKPFRRVPYSKFKIFIKKVFDNI